MNEIVDIARSGGGLVTTAQVVAAGIPRARISDLVKRGKLERVQRGVYCLADAWEDEYLAAQLRFPKGVFSDNTALFLLGYSDRSPFRLTMTFPRAYRATAARKSNIEVRTCSNDVLDLGVTVVQTSYGNQVRAYDVERSLCDMVRGRAVIDQQVFNPAMRQYVRGNDKDLRKLLEYARALGVERKMLGYLQVLL